MGILFCVLYMSEGDWLTHGRVHLIKKMDIGSEPLAGRFLLDVTSGDMSADI
jgi:hypothetical protein